MSDPTDHDGPGTPLGRLKVISAFAAARLGHSPYSSEAAEVVVLETLDRLLKEQAAGISWATTAQGGLARQPPEPDSNCCG